MMESFEDEPPKRPEPRPAEPSPAAAHPSVPAHSRGATSEPATTTTTRAAPPTISAAPKLRDTVAEVKKFVPTSLLVRRDQTKAKPMFVTRYWADAHLANTPQNTLVLSPLGWHCRRIQCSGISDSLTGRTAKGRRVRTVHERNVIVFMR